MGDSGGDEDETLFQRGNLNDLIYLEAYAQGTVGYSIDENLIYNLAIQNSNFDSTNGTYPYINQAIDFIKRYVIGERLYELKHLFKNCYINENTNLVFVKDNDDTVIIDIVNPLITDINDIKSDVLALEAVPPTDLSSYYTSTQTGTFVNSNIAGLFSGSTLTGTQLTFATQDGSNLTPITLPINTGPTGPQGPKGDDGSQGSQGNTGPQGNAGPQGDDGGNGTNGAQGATGPAGPAGSAASNTDLSPANVYIQGYTDRLEWSNHGGYWRGTYGTSNAMYTNKQIWVKGGTNQTPSRGLQSTYNMWGSKGMYISGIYDSVDYTNSQADFLYSNSTSGS